MKSEVIYSGKLWAFFLRRFRKVAASSFVFSKKIWRKNVSPKSLVYGPKFSKIFTPANSRNLTNPRQSTANLRDLRGPRSPHSLNKITLGNIIHARVRSTCCGELYSSGEKQGRRNFGIPSVSTKSVRVFRVSTSKSCI